MGLCCLRSFRSAESYKSSVFLSKTQKTNPGNFVPAFSSGKNGLQMLDAAHGAGVGAAACALGLHAPGAESQEGAIRAARRSRSGGPKTGLRADSRQSSRRETAVARSRRIRAIAGMNAAKSAAIKNEKLKMKNEELFERARNIGHL
ncbi:MAG: hypothetical protein NC209_07535 [Alistipes sp.]|nr:hypothetical protein [Alistipes senegalensis]MCM1250976.1 hypothetical protein [Alistipes sp.]